MPGFIGPTELIFFGVVALLILGPKRLPEMGRSLGRGMREFKDSVTSTDPIKRDEIDVQPVSKLDADTTPDDDRIRQSDTAVEPETVR